MADRIVLDVQQIIPLPEAADYQVQIRQKQRETRAAVEQSVDWTRYDVQVGDTSYSAVWKRQVAFHVLRFLVMQGISPEEIETTIGRRLFELFEGTLDGEAVRAELMRRRPNDPASTKRYYSADDQLLTFGNRTYAISTQWSKDRLEADLGQLRSKYGQLGFSFRPSEEYLRAPAKTG